MNNMVTHGRGLSLLKVQLGLHSPHGELERKEGSKCQGLSDVCVHLWKEREFHFFTYYSLRRVTNGL